MTDNKMKTYTVNEVEEILKVKKRTIRSYIASGKLKAAKIGRGYVVQQSDLEKFISENQ